MTPPETPACSNPDGHRFVGTKKCVYCPFVMTKEHIPMPPEEQHLHGRYQCQFCGARREYSDCTCGPDKGRASWHCGKCGQWMQFYDGICFRCNGGRDPGE